MNIDYFINENVDIEEFLSVLRRSGLADRRPVDDLACIEGMLRNSNLMITARKDGELIGISRSVTDFHYCCYLSDLAVDRAYQTSGVGLKLQLLTKEQIGPKCTLILISAPVALGYYPKIGYRKNQRCFTSSPGEEIGGARTNDGEA